MHQPIQGQFDEWLELIRSEYAEMPGLRLSKRQAQRLWCLDPATCDEIFNTLEAAHFLRRTPTDNYIRADVAY